jgi:hypothetical protein
MSEWAVGGRRDEKSETDGTRLHRNFLPSVSADARVTH